MMLGAIIGAAGSLMGGAMNRNSAKKAAAQERKWALEDQSEQFVRLRAAAEKGGFNPLTVLGASPTSGMVNPTNAAQSYMGDAIATSSLMLADSMSKTAAAATGKKLQNANRANADLTRKLNAATLRPKMAGVFDRPSRFGTGANGQVSTSGVATSGNNGLPSWLYDVKPLSTVDPADPRRPVENKPIQTHAGVMVIDSPWFGKAYMPTLDGDEALQWYDWPSLALPAAQWAWNRGVPAVKQSWNDHRAVVQKRNENWRLEYEAQPKPKPQGAKANFLLGNK